MTLVKFFNTIIFLLLFSLFNSINADEKIYFVMPADYSLSTVARDFFHNPSEWKKIAKLNDIKVPAKVKIGSLILLHRRPDYNFIQNEKGHYIHQISNKDLNSESLDKFKTTKMATYLYEQGVLAFKSEKFESAFIFFRKSRRINDQMPGTWIYELKCLKKLGYEEKWQKIKKIFLKKFPQYEQFLDS
jgi:hypothetical protein